MVPEKLMGALVSSGKEAALSLRRMKGSNSTQLGKAAADFLRHITYSLLSLS